MSPTSNINRWSDTVRHLLPSQVAALIFDRIRRNVIPRIGPPFTSLYYRHVTEPVPWANDFLHAWGQALPGLLPLSNLRALGHELATGYLSFVGHTVVTPNKQTEWHPSNAPSRLWLYHLHYLDPLPGLSAGYVDGNQGDLATITSILDSWDRGNPLGSSPGWDPYPLSIRVVNLIRSAAIVHTNTQLRSRLLTAALRQIVWLPPMIEWHLQANHLWTNAKALVLAGATFGTSAIGASLWHIGQHLLRRELNRQFLPDGGHYERSPMYHHLLLDDLNELSAVLDYAPGFGAHGLTILCIHRLKRAREFDLALRHPDGAFAHFNDTAQQPRFLNNDHNRHGSRNAARLINEIDRTYHGPPVDDGLYIANKNSVTTELRERSVTTLKPQRPRVNPIERLKLEESNHLRNTDAIVSCKIVKNPENTVLKQHTSTKTFRDTGYTVVSQGDWFVVFDHGPIGPPEQPGHAHADMLAIEVSFRGHRLLVNGGTGGYADDPWRQLDRSTASHNTVQIANLNQVDLWGSFRVGARTTPHFLGTVPNIHGVHIGAQCTWATIRPPITHERWLTVGEHLVISDTVNRQHSDCMVARYHFAPGWSIRESTGRSFILSYEDSEVIMLYSAKSAAISSTWYAGSFGHRVERACVNLLFPGSGRCVTEFRQR